MKKIYKVGGHLFSIETDSGLVSGLLDEMKNYVPFAYTEDECNSELFNLCIDVDDTSSCIDDVKQIMEFDDDIAYLLLMEDSDGNNIFRIALNKNMVGTGGTLRIDKDKRKARLCLTAAAEQYHQNFIINNSLMLLYTMFTSTLGTLLIHASVVVNDDKGYAFLGRSGTGKSTHTRLWLNHIEGSSLLNDDNPVVRVFPDGKVVIYGSPWSGKTPCYKNEQFELKSVVRLSQAPYNRITKLSGIKAYAAFSPSASSMKWDKAIADGLHKTFTDLISVVGIYHLECLPDEDAARICFSEIK